MFAAHLNTTVTLLWGFMDLITNPNNLEKLRKELTEYKKEGKDVLQSPFLNQCLKETMRLHTINSLIRGVEEDMMFEGYLLKKGTMVAFPTWIE